MSGGPHVDASDPFQKRAAVSMAIYTVQLALASMLTNQARTKAILISNQAASKWAYFQSKSTKQNLARVEIDILARLPKEPNDELPSKLKGEVDRYETEKTTIQNEAKTLEDEGRSLEHREHYFEYAATVAELAIVLAGVSLLMHSKKVLMASVAVAAASFLMVVYTYFFVH